MIFLRHCFVLNAFLRKFYIQIFLLRFFAAMQWFSSPQKLKKINLLLIDIPVSLTWPLLKHKISQHMRKLVLIVPCLLFILTGVFAQNTTVTGKVTDPSGNPLPRASIKEKGTKNGTIANDLGVFSITVPQGQNC